MCHHSDMDKMYNRRCLLHIFCPWNLQKGIWTNDCFSKKKKSHHPSFTYLSNLYAKLHNLHHYIPHVLTVCTAASEISDLVHANSSIQTRIRVTFVNVALALRSSVPYQVKKTITSRMLNWNYIATFSGNKYSITICMNEFCKEIQFIVESTVAKTDFFSNVRL